MELRQVYTTPDGKTFDTKKEAQDYLRRPKIKETMMKVANDQEDLVNWLIENQETVEAAFEVGTIKRVTKSDRKKLEKALEAVSEAEHNPATAFLVEHADAIQESFRWPSVKRMDEEEKLEAAKEKLTNASDNTELADWVVENRDAVLEAYKAGIKKRKVNPKAAEALAAYRKRKADEKAAKEAASG